MAVFVSVVGGGSGGMAEERGSDKGGEGGVGVCCVIVCVCVVV